MERQNRQWIVDWFKSCIKDKDRKGKYSETFSINPDKTLDNKKRLNDSSTPFIVNVLPPGKRSLEDLFTLIHKISDEHPDLNISVEVDPEWKWMRYEVSEKLDK